MKVTIEIRTIHDVEGEVEISFGNASLSAIGEHGIIDTMARPNEYDPRRKYLTEQAEVMEDFLGLITRVAEYYNAHKSLPSLPESLPSSHQKDGGCNGTEQSHPAPQSEQGGQG